MAHQREPDLKAKLSRKIAELTMVIHLLFTRNHEREIEVDSLKAAYEHEISVIQEEARGKISWLEGQLDDLEKFRVLLDLKNTESEKDKKQIKTLEGKEVELTRLLTQKDQMLLLAEKQIVELKEKVLHKLKIEDEQAALLTIELESAKQMNSNLKDRLKGKTDRIKKYQSQIENLQSKVSSLQRELNNALESKKKLENSVDGLQGDWLDKINELDERIAQFTKQQQDDHDRMEKLEWRNKQLSQQVKDLDEEKRQLELKIQQYINEQNKKKEAKRSPMPPIARESPDVPRTTPAMDRDEELERLRREIQRYRLELSNRESNFNRMFTDHQPVLLEGKNRKTSSGLIPDGSFPNLSGTRKRSGVHSHLPALGEQRVSGNLSQQQFRGF